MPACPSLLTNLPIPEFCSKVFIIIPVFAEHSSLAIFFIQVSVYGKKEVVLSTHGAESP